MIEEKTTELDKLISKKYQLQIYKGIKNLKGIEFNERMKLEFALRDQKNIEAIEYLTIIYNKKKRNSELINSESFHELLKEAKNINFFSLNILDIEFYKHELISQNLFEIFEYLIKTNIENNKLNTSNSTYNEINENLFEEIYNEHNHYFITSKTINKFKIKNSYYYNSLADYEETRYVEKDLEEKIQNNSSKYYTGTNIELKNNNIFVNNMNLSINLAMPENELTDIIKELSTLYKNGAIIKNINKEIEYKSVFNTVGIKYLSSAEYFLKLLFIYDMHHSEDIKEKNNNKDKLFKAISKKVDLSTSTVEDLSGKFKKTLENQLYLQL